MPHDRFRNPSRASTSLIVRGLKSLCDHHGTQSIVEAMNMYPPSQALEQARRYRKLSSDHFYRTLRSVRMTSTIVGVLFLLLAVAFAAMLLPGVRAAALGPSASAPVFAILCPMFVLAGVLMFFFASKLAPPSTQLLAGGLPGRATLHEVLATWLSVRTQSGSISQSALVLDVEVAGAPAYRVVHKIFVPFEHVALLRPGATFAVRVDRTKASRLVIDWGASHETPS
jgi:hypothetical protein